MAKKKTRKPAKKAAKKSASAAVQSPRTAAGSAQYFREIAAKLAGVQSELEAIADTIEELPIKEVTFDRATGFDRGLLEFAKSIDRVEFAIKKAARSNHG